MQANGSSASRCWNSSWWRTVRLGSERRLDIAERGTERHDDALKVQLRALRQGRGSLNSAA